MYTANIRTISNQTNKQSIGIDFVAVTVHSNIYIHFPLAHFSVPFQLSTQNIYNNEHNNDNLANVIPSVYFHLALELIPRKSITKK